MIYRIVTKINDGMAEAPFFDYDTSKTEMPNDLGDTVANELFNDDGDPLPIGTTVSIERIA